MTVRAGEVLGWRAGIALVFSMCVACGGGAPGLDELKCDEASDCQTPGPCEVVEGAECGPDHTCSYRPKTCEEPPGAECVGGRLRTYSYPGTCVAGQCQYAFDDYTCSNCGTNPICDSCDGVVCDDTQSACRSGGHCVPGATPTCVYSVAAPSTAGCDDGDACTYGDHCNGTGGCAGTAITCANDPGTCGARRTCNGTASCSVTYPGTAQTCDDGNACTYGDHCDGNGGCVGTSITCASDAGTCGARRACNGTATCTVTYPGGAQTCDDGNACTYGDHCNGAGGCAGTAITCTNDSTTCGARRTCNGTATCTVTYPGASQACDDGWICTHTDRCNGMGGCGGTAITCANDPGLCGTERSCNGTPSCTVVVHGPECNGSCCAAAQYCRQEQTPWGGWYEYCAGY